MLEVLVVAADIVVVVHHKTATATGREHFAAVHSPSNTDHHTAVAAAPVPTHCLLAKTFQQ